MKSMRSKLYCIIVGGLTLLLATCGASEPAISKLHLGFDHIVSFDVMQHDGRIHLLAAGTSADETHVSYTVSSDGGRHWKPPVAVDTGAPAPHSLGHGDDVQIASSDNRLVAIWPAAGDGRAGGGPLVSAFSTDGGQHWKPGPRPARGFSGGQGYADITADADGEFHLVWLDSRNGVQALYHAQSADGARHWSAPDLVDGATCFCCANELEATPKGELLTLYRDAEPRDMILTEYTDTGTWQPRGVVGEFNWHFNGCPEAGGSLAVAGGQLHALIWTGKQDQAGIYHLVTSDAGHSWSSPQWLAEPSSRDLTLAARDRDDIAAAWTTGGKAGGVGVAISGDAGMHWSQRKFDFVGNSHPRLLATPSGWLLIMRNARDELVSTML